MKLLYATSVTYPSLLANRIQTLETAKALATHLPNAFVLGVGGSQTPLPVAHKVMGRPVWSPLLALRYALLIRKEGFTHVYCREDRLLAFMLLAARFMGVTVHFTYEAHTLSDTLALRFLKHCQVPMVAITAGLRDDLITYGIMAPIGVVHDGVDVAAFTHMPSQEESRKILGLPLDATIALYVGKLDGWKGVTTLLEAHASFPAGVELVLVGGPVNIAEAQAAHYPRVRFLGPRPYEELPMTLAAADLVLLPNTATEAISARHTSPLKLFAYLASGKPLVASDLSSLREVIGEDTAVLVAPDSPEALAEGVKHVLSDPTAAAAMAARGRKVVEGYTWDRRAERILQFIKTSL